MEAQFGSGSRHGVGGDQSRPASAPDSVSARQTDKPAGCQPCRASLSRLPRCLSFHPSTRAFPFRVSALVTVPGGHCIPSILGPKTRAHTRTHTDTAELGYSLPSHFPRRHHLPCTTSQTHPSLAPADRGRRCLEGESLLPSPPCPHLRRLPFPHSHPRPQALEGGLRG